MFSTENLTSVENERRVLDENARYANDFPFVKSRISMLKVLGTPRNNTNLELAGRGALQSHFQFLSLRLLSFQYCQWNYILQLVLKYIPFCSRNS